MTMIADTLYNMLAQKLRGFQACDVPKIYRHFVKGKGKYNSEQWKTNRHVSTQESQSDTSDRVVA